jgi:hypothetical protein
MWAAFQAAAGFLAGFYVRRAEAWPLAQNRGPIPQKAGLLARFFLVGARPGQDAVQSEVILVASVLI